VVKLRNFVQRATVEQAMLQAATQRAA
jgi:hypothetical protein